MDLFEPLPTLNTASIILYEAHSTWWLSYIPAGGWLSNQAGKWLARKVNRKILRYRKSQRAREHLNTLILKNRAQAPNG